MRSIKKLLSRLLAFVVNPWLYLLTFWFGGITVSALGIAHQLGDGWGMLYAGICLMVSSAMVFRGITADG